MNITTDKNFSLEITDKSFDKYNEDFFAINTALDRLEKTLNLHHNACKVALNRLQDEENMLYREAMETIRRLKANHDVKELCNFSELHPTAFTEINTKNDITPENFSFCPLGGDSAFWNEYRFEHCWGGQ